MPPIDLTPFASPPLNDVVETNVDSSSPMSQEDVSKERRERWQDVIDQLLDYLSNPGQLADDGIDPPTQEIIRLAITLADRLKNSGVAAPDRVVSDGDGGFVFERRVNDLTHLIHVWDDETIENQVFHGSRLVQRDKL